MDVFKKCAKVVFVSCAVIVLTAALLYLGVYLFNIRTIRCDSREELSELMEVDLTNIGISDILYKRDSDNESTAVYVFINETRSVEECDYYARLSVMEASHIPPAYVADLRDAGIQVEDIAQYGCNFREIGIGIWRAPYTIYWYQLYDADAEKGNIVFLSWIPRRISLDVDKILADQ